MDSRQKLYRVNYNINHRNKQGLPVLYIRQTGLHVYVQLVHEGKIHLDVSSLNQREALTDEAKSYNLIGAAKIGKIAGKKVKDKLQELGFTNFVTNRGLKAFKNSQVLRTIDSAVRLTALGGKNE